MMMIISFLNFISLLDPHETKYQYLIKKKREKTGLKYCKDGKTLIEHSNYMEDVYKVID